MSNPFVIRLKNKIFEILRISKRTEDGTPPPAATSISDHLKHAFPNQVSRGNKSTLLFPEKLPIIAFEKNGSEIRIDHWVVSSTNVVSDSERNKAADLGLSHPITLVVFGRAYLAYTIDADRGVGINIDLEEKLLRISSTAEEAWAFLESSKLAKWASEDLTGRSKLLMIVMGIIIGQLVFAIFRI